MFWNSMEKQTFRFARSLTRVFNAKRLRLYYIKFIRSAGNGKLHFQLVSSILIYTKNVNNNELCIDWMEVVGAK